MKLHSLRDPERWERQLSIKRKALTQPFKRKRKSKAIFVLGNQRSGTSMLMRTFHRHTDVLVYDEHRNSAAFENYCIRGFDTVIRLVDKARFPVVCFKPICDSHKIREFHQTFSDTSIIWLYRDYQDVANSYLRKFDAPTRAIRLVCTGRPGGGWFEEGVSAQVRDQLQRIYRPNMTDFNLSCLVWWARNQIILESGLVGNTRVILLKYEALVSAPHEMLEWLYERTGIGFQRDVTRRVSARSIRRHQAPTLDPNVEALCEHAMSLLDEAYDAAAPPYTAAKIQHFISLATPTNAITG